jgi:hypothetical protein
MDPTVVDLACILLRRAAYQSRNYNPSGTYGNSQNPNFTTESEIRLHVRDHARWG